MKRIKEKTKKRTQEEFDKTYAGTLDELKGTEFYRAIQKKKNKTAFLEQLEQSGMAKAIIGGNASCALVLEAKRTGEKYEYTASEIENPEAGALTNCVNTKEFEGVWV